MNLLNKDDCDEYVLWVMRIAVLDITDTMQKLKSSPSLPSVSLEMNEASSCKHDQIKQAD